MKNESVIKLRKIRGKSMFCSKCGQEVKEGMKFCQNCGTPVPGQTASLAESEKVEKKEIVYVKHKGYWSTGRLVIGILSILLFVFISFQSCAVGLGNTIMENEASSGTQGVITAICYLVAGIVGIVSRNSLSKGGSVATAILYLIGAFFTIGAGDTYGDLPIWGGLAVIFGIVFIISAVKTNGKN